MAATDVSKIHIGNGDIWTGGTAPAAGSDPTDPTAGTPSALNAMATGFTDPTSGGTYVGATQGPATLTYRPTFYQVETEQSYAPVITTPSTEEATLGFNALELTYANLHSAFGQTKTRVVGAGVLSNTNYVGGLRTVPVEVAVLLSRKRSGVGYWLTTFYQGYSREGSTLPHERRAETRLPVTIHGLALPTRPEGDQLFQIVDYPANPL